MQDLLFSLSQTPGTSGDESSIARVAAEHLSLYGCCKIDKTGNVICTLGDENSSDHIMLDAHIDEVGLIVTHIEKSGFLKAAPCGGIDCRILPGSVVQVHGETVLPGIVCTLPPHLTKGKDDKFTVIDELFIDVGLTASETTSQISPGSRITFTSTQKKLLGNHIFAKSLDNRAGVAALIECARLLSLNPPRFKVTILLSVQEEIGALGASTASYSIRPDEAIVVDVTFAASACLPKGRIGSLGLGPMIGIAPSLSRDISGKLIETARKNKIPYQLEVMNGKTGTTLDLISSSRGGVRSSIVSIPLRYMHTAVEMVNLDDVKNTAKLISSYIKEWGGSQECAI